MKSEPLSNNVPGGFFFFPALSFLALIFLAACKKDFVKKGDASLLLGDYTRAMLFYRQELDRRPDHYRARLGLAKALIQEYVHGGRADSSWVKAERELNACRTLNPEEDLHPLMSDFYLDRSQLLLNTGDTTDAAGALDKALESNPQNAPALVLAGAVRYSLGYEDEALGLLQRAVALDSLNVPAHFNLGLIYWDRLEAAASRKHLQTALKQNPEDPEIRKWASIVNKFLESHHAQLP